MRTVVAVAVAVAALAVSGAQVAASEPEGWRSFTFKDPVTDAKFDGVGIKKGDDLLLLACSENDGARRFLVSWTTQYKLGRGGLRSVTYRFDQQRPITEDWSYTSRGANPAVATVFVDPARRFARRILDSGASQMLFRLSSRDGGIHDIAVPLDETARGLIRPALDRCS